MSETLREYLNRKLEEGKFMRGPDIRDLWRKKFSIPRDQQHLALALAEECAGSLPIDWEYMTPDRECGCLFGHIAMFYGKNPDESMHDYGRGRLYWMVDHGEDDPIQRADMLVRQNDKGEFSTVIEHAVKGMSCSMPNTGKDQ